MGVILDTSVVIAAERGGKSPILFLRQISQLVNDEPVALSAIGLTELIHGIYRADTADRQMRRRLFVDELRAGLRVHPFDEEASLIAGKIDAEAKRSGIAIPTLGLLIGATALALNYSVLTANLRHFAMIPGLRVISA